MASVQLQQNLQHQQLIENRQSEEQQEQIQQVNNLDDRNMNMRYSQLEDVEAARLYEERYRQIQSDMMKKLSQKKPVQKKFQSNPRSSSSLSTLAQSNQVIGNGIKQGILQRNQQIGNNFSSNGNNIISKFQEKRPSSQLIQSTTQSRMATEENAPDYCLVKSGFRQKLKSQKSCDILTFSQDQLSNSSCQATPSIDDQDVVLHRGYLNPNTFIKAQQKQKAVDSFLSSPQHQQQPLQQSLLISNGQQTMKSSKNMGKATQQQDKSTQPVLSSRLLQSPPDKKPSNLTEKYGMNKGISSQTASRHDTSPTAGRAYQAIAASQTFYSPQSTKGGSNTHRRKSIDEKDSKKMKKAESNLSTFVRQPVQNNKEEPSSQIQFHNFGFSNSTVGSTAFGSTSYLMRANLKSSLDSALVAEANSKKTLGVKNINNQVAKRNEIQDIDLRIKTIEKEIEKDGNKLTLNITKKNQQQQQNQQLSQGSSVSATSSMNSSKPSKSTMISSVDSKSISAPANDMGIYTQKATLSKLSKNGDKSNGYQVCNSPSAKFKSEETKKDEIFSNGTVTPTSNQLSQSAFQQKTVNGYKQKKQTKAQNNGLRLQQNEGTFSSDHQSYNNTPRSADHQMHDFRPFQKPSTSLSSRKQVNFKGEGARFLTLEGEQKERNSMQVTPSSPTTSKSQLIPFSSPMSQGVNSFQVGAMSLKKSCFLDSNATPQANLDFNTNNQQESLPTESEISNRSDPQENPQNNPIKIKLSPTDPEISEFEYLEKQVNAKNQTDSSSVVDDASDLSNQNTSSAVNQFREITTKSGTQLPVKNGKTITKQNSQEVTLHSNSLDSSVLANQNKKHEQIKSPGIISPSLRSSDIVSNTPGNSKSQHYNILISSGISATPGNTRKLNGQQQQGQVKGGDTNGNNGYSKQQQQQNLKKQQQSEQLKIKENFISPSSPAQILQINAESLNKDGSQNGASPIMTHHLKNNLNSKNIPLRTSSVNPNNISAASSTTAPSQSNQPTNYLNGEGYSKNQRELHAKQGTINSYQAKPLPEERQLDPLRSSFTNQEKPKKTQVKQARFEDEKQDYQLEQISKNLHKKLNLLLETANQCNENIKSYRINNNNNNNNC